jgi:hypothetical protein
LLQHREWEFLALWQDLVIILLLLIKVWVDQAQLVVRRGIVQLVLVVLTVQVDHVRLELVHLDLVAVTKAIVLVVKLVLQQLLVLSHLLVDQVLVVVAAVVLLLVLSVRVDQDLLLRLESPREQSAKSLNRELHRA